jgi:hypothetical protein
MQSSIQLAYRFQLFVVSTTICFAAIASQAAGKDDDGRFPNCTGFDVSNRGLMVVTEKLSRADALEFRQRLAAVTDASVAKDSHEYDGTILLDCTVKSKLPNDRYGQSVWLIKPSHIFAGGDQIGSDSVRVMSPLGIGSVNLRVGCRYRICAWDLRHLGFDKAVSARKGTYFYKQAISGFYIFRLVKLTESKQT